MGPPASLPLPKLRSGAFKRLASAVVLALAAAACGSSPAPTTYDLSAPRAGARFGGAVSGQIVVSEPTAIQTLEAEKIIAKDQAGAVSFLGGGQWADRLPRLIQARLIETFENSSKLKAVSRPGERVTPDYLLNTEIRAFQISLGDGRGGGRALGQAGPGSNGADRRRTRVLGAGARRQGRRRERRAGARRGAVAGALEMVRWVGSGR